MCIETCTGNCTTLIFILHPLNSLSWIFNLFLSHTPFLFIVFLFLVFFPHSLCVFPSCLIFFYLLSFVTCVFIFVCCFFPSFGLLFYLFLPFFIFPGFRISPPLLPSFLLSLFHSFYIPFHISTYILPPSFRILILLLFLLLILLWVREGMEGGYSGWKGGM